MPNYIRNRLVIKGTNEQIEEVKEFLKPKEKESEGVIDFNNITPMPKWVFEGNLGKKEEEKYGKENCWYEWSIKNWGTKWNAFSSSESDNVIEFETAWNGVPELISKLGVIFPDVEFEYSFADENIGYNIGKFEFKDTIITSTFLMGGSKEAYELAFDLWDCADEWVWNKEANRYDYKDNE